MMNEVPKTSRCFAGIKSRFFTRFVADTAPHLEEKTLHLGKLSDRANIDPGSCLGSVKVNGVQVDRALL